ncbi:hypothetical protein [Kribbella italica]|uniref:Uncharacterized protein n=1 Tax=Kribbella italica TaxID=1540520 RepID=A0A7W9J942_9ACTN|nr:hypothetical protein [Kribbella italica]MBB5837861.1 hypothetical protein [Kribbella italica]
MDETPDIEQYSDESRAALRLRTDELIEGLRAHAEVLVGLRGGSAEREDLFTENEALGKLLGAWDDAVLDHTGTVVPSGGYDDDVLADEEDEEDGGPVGVLTLVTRVDLGVRDTAELLNAGRAAHRRLQPEESEADALVAIGDEAQAVYALLHEAGEPWLELPGTGLLAATRLYVEPEDYAIPGDEDEDGFSPEAIVEEVAVPEGTLLFSESWG